jgi:hypothetical protein
MRATTSSSTTARSAARGNPFRLQLSDRPVCRARTHRHLLPTHGARETRSRPRGTQMEIRLGRRLTGSPWASGTIDDVRAFLARTIRAVKTVIRDGRIPRPIRWGGAIGLAPVPGPIDEIVLLLVGGILWLFYRDQLREAWRHSERPSSITRSSRSPPKRAPAITTLERPARGIACVTISGRDRARSEQLEGAVTSAARRLTGSAVPVD